MLPADSETYTSAVADLDELLVSVRRALVSRYGPDIGAECTSEAARWAVEHPQRLTALDNPAGYLFRVGQTAARRLLRWRHRTFEWTNETQPFEDGEPLDDELFDALRQLSLDHRTAVLLVHGYGFTYRDVAEVLDVSEAAVTNYVHRGLKRLRKLLEDPS